MFCKKICQFSLIAVCVFPIGCNSADRGKHTCAILLESCDVSYSHVVALPVSGLNVPVAPVPLFT
ncbi:MAG: hypothetical protein LBS87_02845, partial [Puniceicoccales bacterium]|nr:hypothetical protein [Puniceicoccales bacterium]